MKPIENSIGVFQRTGDPHMVAIHAKNWMPLGMAMIRLTAEKNDRASTGRPVANMWWIHTPKLMKAMATRRADDPDVAGEPPPGEHRDDHRHHADGREKQDVHLGVAPEPEQVLVQQGAAAPGGVVEGGADQAVEPRAGRWPGSATGTANRTMKAMASIDHTKSGSRFTLIPGARYLKVVTMKLMAPVVDEMPTNSTASAQKSRPRPFE